MLCRAAWTNSSLERGGGYVRILDALGRLHGQHIYQMWRYRYREIHRVQRSYDDLWQELGGIPQQGWYRLPQKPVEYDLGAISSHKRAMYRRRQEMLVRLRARLADGQATQMRSE